MVFHQDGNRSFQNTHRLSRWNVPALQGGLLGAYHAFQQEGAFARQQLLNGIGLFLCPGNPLGSDAVGFRQLDKIGASVPRPPQSNCLCRGFSGSSRTIPKRLFFITMILTAIRFWSVVPSSIICIWKLPSPQTAITWRVRLGRFDALGRPHGIPHGAHASGWSKAVLFSPENSWRSRSGSAPRQPPRCSPRPQRQKAFSKTAWDRYRRPPAQTGPVLCPAGRPAQPAIPNGDRSLPLPRPESAGEINLRRPPGGSGRPYSSRSPPGRCRCG